MCLRCSFSFSLSPLFFCFLVSRGQSFPVLSLSLCLSPLSLCSPYSYLCPFFLFFSFFLAVFPLARVRSSPRCLQSSVPSPSLLNTGQSVSPVGVVKLCVLVVSGARPSPATLGVVNQALGGPVTTRTGDVTAPAPSVRLSGGTAGEGLLRKTEKPRTGLGGWLVREGGREGSSLSSLPPPIHHSFLYPPTPHPLLPSSVSVGYSLPWCLPPMKVCQLDSAHNSRVVACRAAWWLAAGPVSSLRHSPRKGPYALLPVIASLAYWLRRPPRDRKIRLRRDFSGSSHTSDLKLAIKWLPLSGAWRYRVGAGTDWPGVSILRVGEVKSLICNFYLNVAARKIV